MPISELLYSLRCTKLFKRSKLKKPTISNHKDRILSDTTESDIEEGPASAHIEERQHLTTMDQDTQHTVTLSLLDQGMPRHYTRFCLAFRLGETPASEAISRLEAFFQRTFQAQPWLAGYACPVREESLPANKLEIRFSQRDVENFPVKVQELSEDQFCLTYDELCELEMPPSKIPRHLISSCLDRRADTEPARILDVTVNIIRGGLLVAMFLHHGVTDGASMGTIISGQLCRNISEVSPLNPDALAEKAETETRSRVPLSHFPINQSLGSHLEYKPFLKTLEQIPLPPLGPTPPPSEVTSHIFHFSDSTLQRLKADLNSLLQSTSSTPKIPWITTHDALQSLLWHHLTRARIPSLTVPPDRKFPETSTLLIPVNIRKRITPTLPPSYLGGAVALAPATVALSSLLPPPEPTKANDNDSDNDNGDITPLASPPSSPSSTNTTDTTTAASYLLPTAILIHTTIARCTDTYLREVLALTARQDSFRSLVDINVDTASGLDLCITSWAVLPVFDLDFESAGDPARERDADCVLQECLGGGGAGSGGADDIERAAAGAPGGGASAGGFSNGGDAAASGTGTLGMGLGLPDYVRKPWSRDAGGCIILPRDRRAKKRKQAVDPAETGLEVLVQLKTADMQRLMADGAFVRWVTRVVD